MIYNLGQRAEKSTRLFYQEIITLGVFFVAFKAGHLGACGRN